MTSFWERQKEAFELHRQALENSSLLEQFMAYDSVNGPIMKATERKILHGCLGLTSGVGLSLLVNFLLRLRKRPPTIGHKLALFSIGGISPFLAHFGVSSFLLSKTDQRAAYDAFNEWQQTRD